MKTEVKKDELLRVLKKNFEGHRALFEKALVGYKKKALELLEERTEAIRRGDEITVHIHLPVPDDHSDEYECIIRMVEMDVREAIPVEEEEFANYVLDDWHWKRAWVSSVTAYAAQA